MRSPLKFRVKVISLYITRVSRARLFISPMIDKRNEIVCYTSWQDNWFYAVLNAAVACIYIVLNVMLGYHVKGAVILKIFVNCIAADFLLARAGRDASTSAVGTVVALAAVAFAVFAVFNAGHSGASSVWKDIVANTTPSGGDD